MEASRPPGKKPRRSQKPPATETVQKRVNEVLQEVKTFLQSKYSNIKKSQKHSFLSCYIEGVIFMITECNECPDNVIPNPQKIKITKPVNVTDEDDDEFKVQYKYEVAFDRSHINNRAGASEQEKTFIFDLHIDKVIQPVKRTLRHDDIDEDDEFFDFSLELRIDERSEHPCWTMHFIPDQAEEYGLKFEYEFKKSSTRANDKDYTKCGMIMLFQTALTTISGITMYTKLFENCYM